MFGLVKPCSQRMGADGIGRYREHMCGACLALRQHTGRLSTAALNHDALLLGMLVERLATDGGRVARVPAGRCPMRGMRPATVLDPGSPAARYAAAISLMVLHVGVSDHASDRDRGRLAARMARPVTAAWQRRAVTLAPAAAPAFEAIVACTARSGLAEREPGRGFDAYVADVRAAFGHAFAGAALVAGRPERVEELRACGEAFGTIATVVDALDDHAVDSRRGAFNLLAAAWPEAGTEEVAEAVARVLTEAGEAVEACLDRLGVDGADPVSYLLRTALGRRAWQALAAFRHTGGGKRSSRVRSVRSRTRPRPADHGRRRPASAVASLVGVLPVTALCCCDCDCGGCDCDCCGCGDSSDGGGCCDCGSCCDCGTCCDSCDTSSGNGGGSGKARQPDPAQLNQFQQPPPPGWPPAS